MFKLSEGLRLFLYTDKVNLRCGCLRLFDIVKTEIRSNPYGERNVFIFMNKARTIVRLIHFERGATQCMKTSFAGTLPQARVLV